MASKTLAEVCLEIANALRTKLPSMSKFKPINFASNILNIGSNATAASTDIVAGKTAYVGDDYITGTFTGIDLAVSLALTETVYTPASGQYYKKVTVPASAAPVEVWDGTGIIVEPIAVKLATPVIELVEPETEDALAGTWVFNDTINVTSFSAGTKFYLDFTVSGTSSGYEPDTISFDIFGSGARGLGVSGMDFNEGETSNITLYTNVTVYGKIYWWNEAYKTITITSNLADVTNGDTLLTWLQANATKQSTTNLITFTIDGTSYQAVEGMTWYEWCNSDYNTGVFACTSSSAYVTGSSGRNIRTSTSSTIIKGSDYISNGTAYIYASTGGDGA